MKPHELKAIIIILIGALILCIAPPVRGQDSTRYDTTASVMLKIVLLDKPSVHFYRQGYKRGEQYWYLDGKKIKKLPRNWFVFDWRVIK